MKKIIMFIALVTLSSYAVGSNETKKIVSSRRLEIQDSCLKCQGNILCIEELKDTILTTVFNDLSLSNEYHKKYWFYPWSMADKYQTKEFIKLTKDSLKYMNFLDSIPYQEEYCEIIDSLIFNEINTNHIETFCYRLYSKQIYCFESSYGETMALVCCYLRLKDPIYDDNVMKVLFDSFPYGYYVVLNLSEKKLKLFIKN